MRRIVTVLAVATLLAVACGDDDAGTTQGTTPATAAPATTGAPPATTEAPATTAAPTTTAPPSVESPHPFWGAGWDDVWPAEGETAVYEAETWGGEILEITARIEYGVEWQGETWTAFVLGVPEEGESGLVVYLDRSTPWVPAFKGAEGHTPTLPAGQVQQEWFEEPMPMDLLGDVGHSFRHEAPMFLSFLGGRDAFAHDIYYEMEILSLTDTVEVPFGTLEGCFHLGMKVGGPYIGGADAFFTADVWAHPEQFVVSVNEMPVFARIELKEGWG